MEICNKTGEYCQYCENQNGALNILKKSSVVSLETLYSSGEVDTPIRIRIS
jgi:hypothetical protein